MIYPAIAIAMPIAALVCIDRVRASPIRAVSRRAQELSFRLSADAQDQVRAPQGRWFRTAEQYRARRRERRYADSLPEFLDDVVRRLRAGSSLMQALQDTARTPSTLVERDVADVMSRVLRGEPFDVAIESWRRARTSLPGAAEVDIVCAVVALTHQTGSGGARAFDGVAATLRSRLEIRRESQALAAQATASTLLMVGAPVVYVAFGVLTGNSSAAFLFGTPVGLACLSGGLTLDLGSALWMRLIIRGVL